MHQGKLDSREKNYNLNAKPWNGLFQGFRKGEKHVAVVTTSTWWNTLSFRVPSKLMTLWSTAAFCKVSAYISVNTHSNLKPGFVFLDSFFCLVVVFFNSTFPPLGLLWCTLINPKYPEDQTETVFFCLLGFFAYFQVLLIYCNTTHLKNCYRYLNFTDSIKNLIKCAISVEYIFLKYEEKKWWNRTV